MQHPFWRPVFALLLFFYPAWCLLYPFSSRILCLFSILKMKKYEHRISREFRKIFLTSPFLQFFCGFSHRQNRTEQNREDNESGANLLALHYIVCVSGETEGLQLGWQYPQQQWGNIYLMRKEEEASFTPAAQVSLAMELWLILLRHTPALPEIQLPTSVSIIFPISLLKADIFLWVRFSILFTHLKSNYYS